MAIMYREHLTFARELQEILIADLILIVAFDLTLVGGLANLRTGFDVFLYFLPISAVGVTLSFVLHEMMHKFVAQKFGAIAAFMMSQMGAVITIITAMLGFLIGIPGATVIYTNTFTKREEGIVSLAGPLTNFVVFAIFFIAGLALFPNFMSSIGNTFNYFTRNSYVENVINFTLFISILLAFFNMLPIYPLDGSKILRWNKPLYAGMIALIFVIFASIIGIGPLLIDMVFWLIIALVFSLFYRGIGL